MKQNTTSKKATLKQVYDTLKIQNSYLDNTSAPIVAKRRKKAIANFSISFLLTLTYTLFVFLDAFSIVDHSSFKWIVHFTTSLAFGFANFIIIFFLWSYIVLLGFNLRMYNRTYKYFKRHKQVPFSFIVSKVRKLLIWHFIAAICLAYSVYFIMESGIKWLEYQNWEKVFEFGFVQKYLREKVKTLKQMGYIIEFLLGALTVVFTYPFIPLALAFSIIVFSPLIFKAKKKEVLRNKFYKKKTTYELRYEVKQGKSFYLKSELIIWYYDFLEQAAKHYNLTRSFQIDSYKKFVKLLYQHLLVKDLDAILAKLNKTEATVQLQETVTPKVEEVEQVLPNEPEKSETTAQEVLDNRSTMTLIEDVDLNEMNSIYVASNDFMPPKQKFAHKEEPQVDNSQYFEDFTVQTFGEDVTVQTTQVELPVDESELPNKKQQNTIETILSLDNYSMYDSLDNVKTGEVINLVKTADEKDEIDLLFENNAGMSNLGINEDKKQNNKKQNKTIWW
ncbi:hypothetical protein ACJA23_03135 [Mycoplasma corogypsi]|uniref:hypothetical protein n=1 Tax=Mycoplasma corogypsi TaxID=2106 RepID=UPI003872FAF6